MKPQAPELQHLMWLLLNHVRRALVIQLAQRGPSDVSTLAQAIHADMPHVSQNLKALRAGGLVRLTPRGKQRVYELMKTVRVQQARHSLTIEFRSRDKAVLTLRFPKG